MGEPEPFDPGIVMEAARTLSKRPFRPLPADIPSVFRDLSYDQYTAIRQRPGTAIWAQENTGFVIEPLHRGFIFSSPMEISLVADTKARRILYDPPSSTSASSPSPATWVILVFPVSACSRKACSGFSELAIFQGASFFRAVAPGQTLGTMARALSIKTADQRGEEFPAFRAVWIERPTLAAGALVIYALIDSESVTGAYRFTLRPGDADDHRHGMHTFRSGGCR